MVFCISARSRNVEWPQEVRVKRGWVAKGRGMRVAPFGGEWGRSRCGYAEPRGSHDAR